MHHHHDPIGEDTRDLGALGKPHPAEHCLPADDREDNIQRWGRRALIAGIAMPIGLYGTALVAAVLAEHGVFNTADGRLFATLGTIAVTSMSAGLLSFAALERLTRQPRTLIRRATLRADSNARLGEANRQAIADLRQAIEVNNRLVSEAIVTLSAIEKRLAALEHAVEAVPDFSDGMTKGAQVAASVLGLDTK